MANNTQIRAIHWTGIAKTVLELIEDACVNGIEINEPNIMLGLNGSEDLDVNCNIIFISKWEIWKIRNKVKYNQSRIGDQTIFKEMN